MLKARWTKTGHFLFLSFSNDTKAENIITHTYEFIQELSHGNPTEKMVFCAATKISKVFIQGVPWGDPENMDQLITDDALWSEIKKDLLFGRVNFISEPVWANKKIYNSIVHTGKAAVFCSFRDPEWTYLKDILSRPHFFFGERVSVVEAIDRINLPQCTRCWKFGKVHKSCQEVCRICGSDDHVEEDHVDSCRLWVQAGQKTLSECFHYRCANCEGPHTADMASCLHHRKAMAEERKRQARL